MSDVQDVYLANKSVSNIPLELDAIITTNEPKCSGSDRLRCRGRYSDNDCSWHGKYSDLLVNIAKLNRY